MKHYTRVLARVDLDAVEYNIEMIKKNIQKYIFRQKTDFKTFSSFFFIDSGFNFKFNIEKQTGRFQQQFSFK